MWKQLLSTALLLILAGCGTLPSTQKVARIYEREHRDRRVVSVEERQESEHFQAKVDFEITYTTSAGGIPQKDFLKYHRVAEGWVRSQP